MNLSNVSQTLTLTLLIFNADQDCRPGPVGGNNALRYCLTNARGAIVHSLVGI
jgi:hypothetical protein